MKIRETLPDCLGDADRSVRASAAYAVAAVAAFDWPTQWPDLIEALVRALASPNAHLVHGAMHALAGELSHSLAKILLPTAHIFGVVIKTAPMFTRSGPYVAFLCIHRTPRARSQPKLNRLSSA
jgi:hypothetical protein